MKKRKKHREKFTIDVMKPQFVYFVGYVFFSIIGIVVSAIWVVKMIIKFFKWIF